MSTQPIAYRVIQSCPPSPAPGRTPSTAPSTPQVGKKMPVVPPLDLAKTVPSTPDEEEQNCSMRRRNVEVWTDELVQKDVSFFHTPPT